MQMAIDVEVDVCSWVGKYCRVVVRVQVNIQIVLPSFEITRPLQLCCKCLSGHVEAVRVDQFMGWRI